MSELAADRAAENIRHRYRTFADREAKGVSSRYEEFARRVAESDELIAFLLTLPRPKQQPNLLFASVRYLLGTAANADEFEHWVRVHSERIRVQMLARSTQTNEPARCATILPALAQLPEPLALLEVGAAAGLCLLPERYGYDYGRIRLLPPSSTIAEIPIFPCTVDDATPLPAHLPEVVWRGGLDLNPIDLDSAEDVKWLEALVWPGQEGRLERLSAAIRIAQQSPPTVRPGDVLTDLEGVLAEVPSGATLVIFHSAVLAYLPPEGRESFAKRVQEIDAVWVSNEAPGVFPDIDAKVSIPNPVGRFLLSVNGEPVAFTGPHGQSITWLGGSQRA
jgi:hypothetical protein